MNLKFAHYPIGRVVLHLACLAHDCKFRWHWTGIRREFHALALPHQQIVTSI
jgi:hypothetical protein